VTALTIVALGRMRVWVDDRPVTSFRSERTRALLAMLAVEPGPQQRSRLASLLWPDHPMQAALHNLRQTLLHLRGALAAAGAPSLLSSRRVRGRGDAGSGSSPSAGTDEPEGCSVDVDVASLLRLLDEADHLDQVVGRAAAVQHRQRAVDLYGGPLLEGLDVEGSDLFDDWLRQHRTALHHRVTHALEDLVVAHEVEGNHRRALQAARRWLQLEGLDERAHRAVMRVLAADGRTGAALEQFEQCRLLREAELGVAPSSRTLSLAEALVAGGPARKWTGHTTDGPLAPAPFAPADPQDTDATYLCRWGSEEWVPSRAPASWESAAEAVPRPTRSGCRPCRRTSYQPR